MKILGYIKDTVNASYQIGKMVLKNGKRTLLMDFVLGLSRECYRIINFLLPTIVIQMAVLGQGMSIVFLSILIASLLLVGTGIVIETLQRQESNYGLYATNSLYYVLNGKAALLDLEDCEDEGKIDEYYKVFDNIYKFHNVPYLIFCTLISRLLSFLVMGYVFLAVDWRLFVLVLLTHLLIMAVRSRQDRADHAYEEERSESSKRLKYLKELIYDFEARREMRVYDASRFVGGKYYHESKKAHQIEMRMERADFGYGALRKLIEAAQLLLIYIVAVVKYGAGKLALGNFVLYINATTHISLIMSDIAYVFSFLHQMSFYYKDFEKFLNTPETIRESGTKKEKDIAKAGAGEVLVEFQHVSFRYPGKEELALSDVSFQIRKGESISVVGDNGAGKSTLVKLLLRLYDPTEGCVLYRGVDIREYDYDTYQSFFAPVFQDYVMHAYTLKENLVFDHSRQEGNIPGALSKVGMLEKVQKLGLDRNYSRRFFEDGVEFSGGEEQKLAIARAFCKGKGLLVLDEPTAAIDPLSESKLFQEIFQAAKGETVLYISHRMSSSKFSNRVLVLDHARLVESGTHQELIKQGGIYADIFQKQAGYYV